MINGMKVEVLLRESIKPSSPTPHHLRTFNLSFLDQIAPPIYVPLIFFYASDGDGNNKMEACRRDVLKKSLSEILTRYYPLSGRIKEDSFIIDCNDDGVDYLEARVHNNCRPVSEFIQNPDVHLLKQFLPFDPYGSESSSEFGFESGFNSKVLLAVQVSFFD
ncbi:Transferase [Macleaya cordata]|uniref:Transferase n=1 Tax=Macleaya cordata TaxID=56857 RepID=A0A200Q7H0_MACCD|nr:Transferase [Macleaya cordata]